MQLAGLIAGLGNPSTQYAGTRHNMGYLCAEAVLRHAETHGRVDTLNGGKFQCELWRCTLDAGRGTWLVAKPETYMNNSGDAIQPLLAWHKLLPSQLVVLHDELDIAPGCLRFKFGGGNAGHNGLKSITQRLGTPDFYRLRLGIGRPPHKGDIINWVLGRPDSDTAQLQHNALAGALQTLWLFMDNGLQYASKYALSITPS